MPAPYAFSMLLGLSPPADLVLDAPQCWQGALFTCSDNALYQCRLGTSAGMRVNRQRLCVRVRVCVCVCVCV